MGYYRTLITSNLVYGTKSSLIMEFWWTHLTDEIGSGRKLNTIFSLVHSV